MNKLLTIGLSLIVILGAIFYKDILEPYLKKIVSNVLEMKTETKHIYTSEELSQYNGQTRDKVYLAIMGTIFDVSEGLRHYGKGSPYNYFVGKDGSRAFITGNFKDDSKNKDHILDLTCDELVILLNWKKTFKGKYKPVGLLIGRYFNSEGIETKYTKQFYERIEHCKEQKEIAKKENAKYPPCNISWNADEGTQVWCTKSSGGVTRSWTGVPRQLYTPGEDKPRCVCVNISNNEPIGLFKEYQNCSKTSTSCTVGN